MSAAITAKPNCRVDPGVLSCAVKASLTLLFWPLFALADTVILQSGEQLPGDVIEQTHTNLTLRLFAANRTISYTRVLAGDEIRSLVLEAPAAKAQRAAHDELRLFRLLPDQELTAAGYARGIAACERFLNNHPTGLLADDVRHRLADWRAEQARLADGQVKYRGRWFWPAGKADAIAADRERAAQEARQQETTELHRRLTRLQAEHDNLARGLAEAEASLQRSQYALDALPDIVIPIVEDRLVTVPLLGPAVYFQPLEYRRMVVDEKVIPHPERAPYEARVVFYQRQVTAAKQQLADLKQELAAIRDRLAVLAPSKD